MTIKNIVTCFPITEKQVEQIRLAIGPGYEVIVSSQEEIGKNLFHADLFCGHAKKPVDWPAVVSQGRLKWIQSTAAGLDHCLAPSVIESEIMVSGCSGLFANQVAEQTLALLTGLIRRLPVFFRAQQNREFIRRQTDDLFGKTVGIAGLGGNGVRIATVLRPLVAHIIATDVFDAHCQTYVEQGIVNEVLPADQLEKMLAEVDILILTLPLTHDNENRISDEQFEIMRAGTYLINVGRGSVVNTDSLIRSLATGHLAGAGIDVVEPEPLPTDSRLWAFDNVIITPHVGAQSELRVPSTVDLFCENAKRYHEGQSLLNLVDKRLGFPRPEFRIPF
jgi:D-3-phosphoglycerate dehydrogenase